MTRWRCIWFWPWKTARTEWYSIGSSIGRDLWWIILFIFGETIDNASEIADCTRDPSETDQGLFDLSHSAVQTADWIGRDPFDRTSMKAADVNRLHCPKCQQAEQRLWTGIEWWVIRELRRWMEQRVSQIEALSLVDQRPRCRGPIVRWPWCWTVTTWRLPLVKSVLVREATRHRPCLPHFDRNQDNERNHICKLMHWLITLFRHENPHRSHWNIREFRQNEWGSDCKELWSVKESPFWSTRRGLRHNQENSCPHICKLIHWFSILTINENQIEINETKRDLENFSGKSECGFLTLLLPLQFRDQAVLQLTEGISF